MSKPLPPRVPPPLARLIDDDVMTEDNVALQLVTVRPDGWPHLSMISVGEIVTSGQRGFRLALWPDSNAVANVSATGRATLTTVVGGVPYSLRLSLTGPKAIHSSTYGTLAAFAAHIEEARADVASYADVESGISFRLRVPADVLPRWSEFRTLLRHAEL